MDEIVTNVFVSSCEEAANLELLLATGITHILAIGTDFTELFRQLKYFIVQIDDDEHENALKYFDAATEFISASASAGKVLVHCAAGVSRSPTFVAAYLLKSRAISVDAAMLTIKSKHASANPNDGFIAQLHIYHRMGCKIVTDSLDYRRFLLAQAAAEQQLLGTITKLKLTASPTSSTVAYLRCKTCRRALVPITSIISHEVGAGQAAFQYRKRDTAIARLQQQSTSSTNRCAGFFTEPMDWMREVSDGSIEGKVLCPGCDAKLGSFSWPGISCSCGTWVAPAFMINKQKVDVLGNI
ncbi:hypothetical protein HK100_006330 [Physocladia obscura]|uniref:protein-tyrosine-phosphatase n=1 Tax=Physocladia obscura TaxID=109957 RepID=A0AAD5SQK6_9FUNG|nr:hypothetical protein HK100_006330 [Physocladia obscura]